MPPAQASRPPRRGPKPGSAVRAALLRAAADSILEDGPEALSFRAVARRARVTPAMVPYYFESRLGLQRALLEEGFAPVLAQLERAADETDALSAEDAERLLEALLLLVSERPWLPLLMLGSVLAGDALRSEFVARFAPRVSAAGARILARASDGSGLRQDLDPRLSLLSTLAMCVFPFLARPVVERVFGLNLDASFARAQASHVTRLLAASS